MEQSFEVAQLVEQRRLSGDSWLEFLRVPALSMGLYVLAAGADDPQTPHTEDEVYYIVGGRGLLRVDGRDLEFRPGSLLFVPARAEHRFHAIQEELRALVFFAPAEGSLAASGGR
jgi:mannose-6-phosphate isomerase-like protein (cupin superfamily)